MPAEFQDAEIKQSMSFADDACFCVLCASACDLKTLREREKQCDLSKFC